MTLHQGNEELKTVEMNVCDDCFEGRGGECHVPGCAFWMKDAPTDPLRAFERGAPWVDRSSRWEEGLQGFRVLVFAPSGEPRGYGMITGYEVKDQSFYVLMDGDMVGDPDYVAWMDVRPA